MSCSSPIPSASPSPSPTRKRNNSRSEYEQQQITSPVLSDYDPSFDYGLQNDQVNMLKQQVNKKLIFWEKF